MESYNSFIPLTKNRILTEDEYNGETDLLPDNDENKIHLT